MLAPLWGKHADRETAGPSRIRPEPSKLGGWPGQLVAGSRSDRKPHLPSSTTKHRTKSGTPHSKGQAWPTMRQRKHPGARTPGRSHSGVAKETLTSPNVSPGLSTGIQRPGVSDGVTSRSGWNHDLVRSRFRIHRQSRRRSYSRTRFRSHTQRRGRRRNPRGDRGRSLRRRPGPRCRTRD